MQKQDQKQMKLRYNPKCVVASAAVVGGYWLLSLPPTAGSRSPSV